MSYTQPNPAGRMIFTFPAGKILIFAARGPVTADTRNPRPAIPANAAEQKRSIDS